MGADSLHGAASFTSVLPIKTCEWNPSMMKTLKIVAFAFAASLSFNAAATSGGNNPGRVDPGSKSIVGKGQGASGFAPVNRMTPKSLSEHGASTRLGLAAAYDKSKNAPVSSPSHGDGGGHPGSTPGGCAPGGPVASAS
jgi:hypothetical protein